MKIGLFIVCGITLLVLLILYEGCGDKIRMHSDPKAMKEEILKKVPIGSRIEDAKRMMEENGFDCEMMRNSAFSEDVEDDPNRHIVHERADFLSCDKSKTTFPPVTQEWSVAIVHKGGIVSDVFVNVGLTGP